MGTFFYAWLLAIATSPCLHHYVFYNIDHARIADAAFVANPAFEGAQLKYNWRELEPQPGRYDFSSIEHDLAFLRAHKKKLWIQLQDVSFDSTRINVPEYLLHDSAYHGGIEATWYKPDGATQPRIGGWVARRWDPAVQRRFAELLNALGRAFDGRIEGINLPETSLGWTEFPGGRPADFTPLVNRQAVITNMTALRRAFKKSVVMQYANFMAGEWLPEEDHGHLRAVYEAARRLHVSVGGPDLMPRKPGQMKHSYPLIAAASAVTPNGIAVQEGNYAHVDPATHERVRIVDLLDFAANNLRVKYVFWYPEEPYFTRDVVPALSQSCSAAHPALQQSGPTIGDLGPALR